MMKSVGMAEEKLNVLYTIDDKEFPSMDYIDAHKLCEYKVLKALGKSGRDPTADLDYYDVEMENCTEEYCNFVIEQFEEAKKLCKDPLVLVEQRLDFSRWVPDGFGTGDCLIVADDVLHIIDSKYGLGVL